MNRLATATIIFLLLSASIAAAQEHWVGNDIIFDGKTYYKVYGWGYNPAGGYIYGLQKCDREGRLIEPDVVIRYDVSPEQGFEAVSGPSATQKETMEEYVARVSREFEREIAERKAQAPEQVPEELTDPQALSITRAYAVQEAEKDLAEIQEAASRGEASKEDIIAAQQKLNEAQMALAEIMAKPAEPRIYTADIETITVVYDATHDKYDYFRTTPSGETVPVSQFEVEALRESEPRILYYKELSAKNNAFGLSAPKSPEQLPFDVSMVEVKYNPETKKYTYYVTRDEETFDLTETEIKALKESDPETMANMEYVAFTSAAPKSETESDLQAAVITRDENKKADAKAAAQAERAKEPEKIQAAELSVKEAREAVLKAQNQVRQAAKELQSKQDALADASNEYEEAISTGDENKIKNAEKKYNEAVAAADKAVKDEAIARQNLAKAEDALKSARQTLAGIMTDAVALYQMYSGMAGWSSLIFDEEFLQKWRDGINKVMCEYTKGLLGKQCLISKICGRYYDIEEPRDGILYSSPAGGFPEAVAHIEGQRSLPFITPNETMWVYTVTLGLSDPSEEEGMTYNIVFNGPTRSARWWPEPQYLPKRGSVSATGAAALMKLSSNDYREVCIEFDPSIDTFDGKHKDHICNQIVQYTGGATAPYGITEKTKLAPPGTQPGAAPGATV
ncbi:MAG: hypothetical protein QXT19_00930 [Candidatus Woesearchaeota archaeon]